MKWPNSKFLRYWIAPPVGLVLAIGLGWGIWRWATYPQAPDPRSSDFETMYKFVASKDFDRMFESSQQRYVLAMVERLRDKPFEELVAMALQRDPSRREVAEKIRKLPQNEDVAGAFLGVFLDKFYEMPEEKRTVYLMGFVTLQRSRMLTQTEGLGLPSPEHLKRNMTRFVTRQSPRIQARTGQFLLDLRRQREVMGYPDPMLKAP